MGKKKSSGNVFGNVFQTMPQQNAEYKPNRSIPSLPGDKSTGIADGSIPARQWAQCSVTTSLRDRVRLALSARLIRWGEQLRVPAVQIEARF
jgi:hypothetical protein